MVKSRALLGVVFLPRKTVVVTEGPIFNLSARVQTNGLVGAVSPFSAQLTHR
jgi:hypothetical protein